MASELTWDKAIRKMLGDSPRPLHSTEIAELIQLAGLRANYGATPSATVAARIYTSIKNNREKSPYIQVSKGIFSLREHSVSQPVQEASAAVQDEGVQIPMVSSFGIYWKQDGVDWSKSSPQLLGVQGLGAKPVNFCEQVGIYMLYDVREVIYVGRAEDSIGKRLYAHTRDRLSARWDRFSWFGMKPVSEGGKLGKTPTKYAAKNCIPTLEALLIEALEPRQNRKRGDDFSAFEYLQKLDPVIEKKRVQRFIADKL